MLGRTMSTSSTLVLIPGGLMFRTQEFDIEIFSIIIMSEIFSIIIMRGRDGLSWLYVYYFI